MVSDDAGGALGHHNRAEHGLARKGDQGNGQRGGKEKGWEGRREMNVVDEDGVTDF
jgi:hypothetical protein